MENPFVHRKVPVALEDFESDTSFDLVTLRMVAEHVQDPTKFVRSLARCTAPGGRVVVYTVNRFSPVPLITSAVPFALHHPAKRILWGTETKDTFPTYFRMNTRRSLRSLFESESFSEESFAHLDDCRTTGAFRFLQRVELGLWRALRTLGMRYPENCLLGVYRKS
jgi:SAM-dependent methyltransferase